MLPPSSNELIYAYHDRGFALLSMRSLEVSRLYIQCAPDENINEWPDEKIWGELHTRLAAQAGSRLRDGPILHKGATEMRSFGARPMPYGRRFAPRDAAQ